VKLVHLVGFITKKLTCLVLFYYIVGFLTALWAYQYTVLKCRMIWEEWMTRIRKKAVLT